MIRPTGISADDFESVYRRTAPDILAYLLRRLPVREDAADLLAEVYLTAWRRREALPAPPGDRLWLFGVARRTLLAHHRAETRRHAAADDLRALLVPAGEAPPGAGEAGPGDPCGEAVRAALAALADVDRELLTLTVWDGLSPAEAARVLDLRPGTARVRLHRARSRLARTLGEDEDPRFADGGRRARRAANASPLRTRTAGPSAAGLAEVAEEGLEPPTRGL